MRNWIGKAIIFIGAVHIVFGLITYNQTFNEIAALGFFNTINGELHRELAFWFIIFGPAAIMLGLLADWCERESGRLPRFFGFGLLALAAFVIIPMPNSGGWALLVPAFAAIFRRGKQETEAAAN